MNKFRLMSAVLLAGLMTPTIASALPSEELKMVLQARKETYELRASLRQKLASGQGDADKLRERLDRLKNKIAHQNERIEKIREKEASA
jgi:predicted nuclease with TOPRIM domain